MEQTLFTKNPMLFRKKPSHLLCAYQILETLCADKYKVTRRFGYGVSNPAVTAAATATPANDDLAI
jgi:hypothetical protein